MTVALATFLLAFAAFASIAAAMERHIDDLQWTTVERAARWRVAGWALLAVSLLPCLAHWNPSVAFTAWCGLLTFAALAWGLLLTYSAVQRLRHVVPAAGLLGMLLATAAVF